MNEHEKVVRKLNHHVEALLQANEALTAEQSGNLGTAGQILCSGNSEEIDALKVCCVCKLISLKEGSGRSLLGLVW